METSEVTTSSVDSANRISCNEFVPTNTCKLMQVAQRKDGRNTFAQEASIQGGPLPIISGVITPINGRK